MPRRALQRQRATQAFEPFTHASESVSGNKIFRAIPIVVAAKLDTAVHRRNGDPDILRVRMANGIGHDLLRASQQRVGLRRRLHRQGRWRIDMHSWLTLDCSQRGQRGRHVDGAVGAEVAHDDVANVRQEELGKGVRLVDSLSV